MYPFVVTVVTFVAWSALMVMCGMVAVGLLEQLLARPASKSAAVMVARSFVFMFQMTSTVEIDLSTGASY
jgi:hypothetical protein